MIYLPIHPLAGTPTRRNRLACFFRGHINVVATRAFPGYTLICSRCGLASLVEYPVLPRPPVTLPEQGQGRQH